MLLAEDFQSGALEGLLYLPALEPKIIPVPDQVSDPCIRVIRRYKNSAPKGKASRAVWRLMGHYSHVSPGGYKTTWVFLYPVPSMEFIEQAFSVTYVKGCRSSASTAQAAHYGRGVVARRNRVPICEHVLKALAPHGWQEGFWLRFELIKRVSFDYSNKPLSELVRLFQWS